jgi:hypothetical protein
METGDAARKQRAKARSGRMVLHKARVGDPELDFSPVRGASAISLLTRLSSEAHSLAGVSGVAVPRASLPVRFVPRAKP